MKLLVAFAFLSVASFSLCSANSAREVINFDFRWRFHLGEIDANFTCPASEFPKNLTGKRCNGLHHTQAQTADECRGDCCQDTSCAIWQFATPASDEHHGCWIGQSDDCTDGEIWISGGRDVPPPTPPPATSGPTTRTYNDSAWEVVDAPHDGIISGTYSQTASGSHGYLPFNTTWYRKHFNLPAEWKGSSIWVYFEGIFRSSTVYLNGVMLLSHSSGYTSFSVRLDNVTTLLYGNGSENENVLAVHAQAQGGSGWWYEGGGIYRHNKLVRTPTKVHFVTDGVYAASNVTGSVLAHAPGDRSEGLFASSGAVYPRVEVVNDGDVTSAQLAIQFVAYDADGNVVTHGNSEPFQVESGKVFSTNDELVAAIANVELWSTVRPYLYQLHTQLVLSSTPSQVIDEVNVTFGVRDAKWTGDKGFFLNGEPFKWRGFCDHNDFTGVGVAVPDRINFFRAQSLRGVGGNSWRMSHNPPVPALLDILDQIGVLVWDENRQFGLNNNWVINQRDMVKRDRNHPSVIVWSFCNEGGCNPKDAEEAGQEFKKASNIADPFRPVTGNMIGNFGQGLSVIIDIQGFSHKGGSVFDDFHKQFPDKPTIGSECCSCRTQRGEDVADSKKPNFGNFNAGCMESQNGAMLWRNFVSGSLVWTLFDYYGEPSPYYWPMVSSSFGSIDLAGFPKAAAYWYRSWWLHNTTNLTSTGYDIPHNPPNLFAPEGPSTEGFLAHIVQHWEADVGGDSRTIQGYTNAPLAELLVNGKSQGVVNVSWMGWAEWQKVTFAAGSITMVVMISPGHVVAKHTVSTSGKAASLKLSIDVPSETTGTGSALVLDGQDAGMVRATILDSSGNVVQSASNNVTFRIVSGPGRIIGVGNGDPTCHEPNKVSWRSAYHGLARAIIQVTSDQASSKQHRQRLIEIDTDPRWLTTIVQPGMEDESFADAIVVEGSADGIGSDQVSIPLSTDLSHDGVLATAKRWMNRR